MGRYTTNQLLFLLLKSDIPADSPCAACIQGSSHDFLWGWSSDKAPSQAGWVEPGLEPGGCFWMNFPWKFRMNR